MFCCNVIPHDEGNMLKKDSTRRLSITRRLIFAYSSRRRPSVNRARKSEDCACVNEDVDDKTRMNVLLDAFRLR